MKLPKPPLWQALFFFAFSGAITGALTEEVYKGNLSRVWLLILSYIITCFSGLFAFKSGHVEFGSLGLPANLFFPGFIVGIFPLLAMIGVLPVVGPLLPFTCIPSLCVFVWWIINMRGPTLYLPFLGFVVGSIPKPSVGFTASAALGNFHVGICLLLASFMPYLQDQRLSLLYSVLLHNSFGFGGSLMLPGCGPTAVSKLVMLCIMIYLTCIFARRGRVLPPALRHCRFVRLDYLRTMVDNKQLICRMQELPDEVFGDVTKCEELIITSHRWLDRYTCDVVTEAYPAGLRLTTMMQNLDKTYIVSLAKAAETGWLGFLPRLLSAFHYSSTDVLLFFDFMSLPQIGKDNQGELIQRTSEETTAFMEALPAMGALYCMYQVIVLPEVSQGVHPYWHSGWCFSEFCGSLLNKKLTKFSPAAVVEYMDLPKTGPALSLESKCIQDIINGTVTEESKLEFRQMYEADLLTKVFFSEADRETVGGIIHGFFLRRQLADAVLTGDSASTRRLLTELRDNGLIDTIDHAVDESLDTLLHIAARLPSQEIVELLLAEGAKPTCKNLRGDTPTEFFWLPRFTGGARAIRSRCSADYVRVPEF